MGVLVNEIEPTIFGRVAERSLRLMNTHEAINQPARWFDPGWIGSPRGFNAGMLPDDRVAAVVERIGQFGKVIEVRFDRPPLVGLRLFYIDRVPYDRLGVPRAAVTITEHPAPGALTGK